MFICVSKFKITQMKQIYSEALQQEWKDVGSAHSQNTNQIERQYCRKYVEAFNKYTGSDVILPVHMKIDTQILRRTEPNVLTNHTERYWLQLPDKTCTHRHYILRHPKHTHHALRNCDGHAQITHGQTKHINKIPAWCKKAQYQTSP